MAKTTELREWVSDYYGKVLKQSDDLKTNACCASGGPPKHLRKFLANIHPDVDAKFYGKYYCLLLLEHCIQRLDI